MAFKSTHEILASITGRSKPDLWERVTAIPEFDPEKHSDGCSCGMSANYAKLPRAVRDILVKSCRGESAVLLFMTWLITTAVHRKKNLQLMKR